MEDFSRFLKLINNCDPDYPLLSSTRLGHRLDQIPLCQVSIKGELLAGLYALNLKQLVPTRAGLARDYRGLAELMGFGPAEIETRFKRSHNPTKSLIDAFVTKNLIPNRTSQHPDATLNSLLKMLERLERFDVIDDLMPALVQLAQIFEPKTIELQARTESQEEPAQPLDAHFDRLTVDDAQQRSAIMYDAFICFAPDDFEHAQRLIMLLEQQNKRIATADDLLPGHLEFDALMRLIDTRCRKVILLLTPNFLRSRECEFRTKFASELAIKSGTHNIIPVLCEMCDDMQLPSTIRVLSKIDMTNPASLRWQLNKLIYSLDIDLDTQRSSSPIPQLGRQLADESRNLPRPNNRQDLRVLPNGIQAQSIPLVTLNDQPDVGFLNGPIVDLMQSQSSSTCSQPLSSISSRRASPVPASTTSASNSSSGDSSGKPISWISKVTRRLIKSTSNSSTNGDPLSSQARLVYVNSGDYLHGTSPSPTSDTELCKGHDNRVVD